MYFQVLSDDIFDELINLRRTKSNIQFEIESYTKDGLFLEEYKKEV